MFDLRKYLMLGVCVLLLLPYARSQSVNPDPHYTFLKGPEFIQDKNFYLLTLLEKMPAVNRIIAGDTALQRIHKIYGQRIANPVTSGDVKALTAPVLFTDEMMNAVKTGLLRLWQTYPVEMGALLKQMRSSGVFQLYADRSDATLLTSAWEDAAKGINYIINAYTTNEGFRYPKIDGAAFDVTSPRYKQEVIQLFNKKDARTGLFFRPALDLALGMLLLNKRDEAVRYEPLWETNRKAYTYLKTLNWDKYTYTTLLILGAGPANTDPISEACKNRCRMGADLFRKGMAPCIIVSGGHVHPNGTPYSEAVEMKKYLTGELGIPAEAVILEPYARHTTTNIRNAVRIMWRNGVPVNKRMMCVSDAMHLSYVTSKMFAQRSQEELGYMPMADIRQSELFFINFIPDIRSLQADARDPLDP